MSGQAMFSKNSDIIDGCDALASADNPVRFIHGDGFADSLAMLTGSEKFKKFCAVVNEKKHSVKDGDTTYRIIHHWTQQGLFDDERPDDSMDWRKLSLKDIMWLRIARDIRKFGLPLDALKVTYKCLWKRRYGAGKRTYPWLEVVIALCRFREPVVLVVFEDGYAEIATPESLAVNDFMVGIRSRLCININDIYREITGDDAGKYIPRKHNLFALNQEEISAITALGDVENGALKLHVQDGKVTRIDTSKQVEGAARIVDILKETEFGEVTVKVANGKPVHTQMVKTEKPRK
jgi:hypothetical protein